MILIRVGGLAGGLGIHIRASESNKINGPDYWVFFGAIFNFVHSDAGEFKSYLNENSLKVTPAMVYSRKTQYK